MSENTKKTTPPKEEKAIEVEAEYTVQELAAASQILFGGEVMPECVIAAFRVAGIEKATKEEAEKIVTKYLTKEVR